MRSYVPDFELRAPADLSEALTLLAESPGGWAPFAGGTDIMVLFEAGKLSHKRYLSLWGLDELRGISVDADWVSLGALTTYSEVREDPTLSAEFPMLGQAARETGGLAIQNRGTIGGNIANASPAADSPPALLAYDAELEIVSAAGSRRLAYADFPRGYKQFDLAQDELIARVWLPRAAAAGTHRYEKVGTRRAQAISKVVMAARGVVEDGRVTLCRLAFGSVAPISLRCRGTEAAIEGASLSPKAIAAALQILDQEISPIDDIRSTARYRRRVAQNLARDFFQQLGASRA